MDCENVDREKDSIDRIQSELSEWILHIESARRKDRKLGKVDRSATRLLGQLIESGPMSAAALSEVFQLDPSTVSRQTSALVGRGLVQRVSDPKDGRVSLLEVTDAGRDAFMEMREARRSFYTELLRGWPEEDKLKFGNYLRKLNQDTVDLLKSAAKPSK
ncbi:MarR family transcriptional regulator [Alicyclobacillus tolerans]|uniref:MarR family winged helix-turn-helix transcriptional regulator n=1 Tax=Alicyclobacillus tolerans TaxID=90970 RepID=UPI001F01A888|nr:MarR family transcriptional regulator [Alicyclobacillus tolerans]MCF8565565.1 MarR family transcriptional regulator [Alicyclobacillus tolerans]